MSFIKVGSVLSLVFASVTVFASADLGGVMKRMGDDMKKIEVQVLDPNLNAATIALCDDLMQATELSKSYIPSKVAKLPAAEQPEQMRQYVAKLDQMNVSIAQLKAKLLVSDNAAAQALVLQIKAVKSEGHKQFKSKD